MMKETEAIKTLKYLPPLNVKSKPINNTMPTIADHTICDSIGNESMYFCKSFVSDIATGSIGIAGEEEEEKFACILLLKPDKMNNRSNNFCFFR